MLPAGQVDHGGQQRMPLAYLGVPVVPHHQRAGTLQLQAQEPQQRQRRRIGPVQVIQDQQQRPARGRRPQEARQAVEQPEPRLLRFQRRRKRKIRNAVTHGGDQLSDVGRADAQVITQRGRVADLHLHIAADDLDPGPERGRARPFPAPTPQHHRAAHGRPRGQLLGQPGLADAGLARHQHDPTTAGRRGIQVGGESGQLTRTAHQRSPHADRLPSPTR